jgi:hypothetical protein
MDRNRWKVCGYEDEYDCTEGRRKRETKNRKPTELKMNRDKNFSISLGDGVAVLERD